MRPMRILLAALTLLATGHAALAGPAVEPIDRHGLAELPQYVRAGAAATTSGLATWAVGEQDAASKSRGGALAGALIGGSLGAITSIAVTNALANRFSDRFTHRVAIASGLIASGASLGYQIGGGGPR